MFRCSNIKTVEQNNSVIASPKGVAIAYGRSPHRYTPRDNITL